MSVYVVEWRPRAQADLLDLVAYIAEDNPDAAQALMDDIEARAASLAENPKRYKPGRMKGTREMVVRPNYIVIYRVVGQTVQIGRVKHAAQQWP